MTKEENDIVSLNALCMRVEFAAGWPYGTLKSKSSTEKITRLRDQVILRSFEDGMKISQIAEYFDKTVQAIYESKRRAKERKSDEKIIAEIHGWLCDV